MHGTKAVTPANCAGTTVRAAWSIWENPSGAYNAYIWHRKTGLGSIRTCARRRRSD